MPEIKRLSFLGEVYGAPDYLDILSLPGTERRCATAFLDHLAESHSFDLLELDAMPAESYTLRLLALRFGNNAKFRYKLIPQYICPQVTLDGDFDAILERSQRSSYFKRCLRRLKKIESFEFRVATDAALIPAAFDRFVKLHDGRWVGRGGSGATRSPEVKGFIADVAYEMARAGRARFEEIWLEGECRASLLGFESGDRFYFYLSGFDESWSKYSLGFTLLWLSIREAVGRGLKVYDFLRGDESYKFMWSNNMQMTVGAQVTSDSSAAKIFLAQNHAREIARAIVPDGIKAFLRRNHRQSKFAPGGALDAKPEAATGIAATYDQPLLAED
jgi:hypothetical protein